MKNTILKLIALITVIASLFAFASGCKKENSKNENTQKDTSVKSSSQSPAYDENTKYGKSEVYKKGDKSYAKTEDGEEVELSGENLQKLMEMYQKVQGTDSKEEKELLDKIQLFLEAPRK